MRAIFYGLLASFFFASTFVLNRSMELAGGHWAWSACLRFFFMLPMLLILVSIKGQLANAWQHLVLHPKEYLLWSTLGFGLFYAPLCFASVYGEGWLVASTWQLVIICGSLVAPFFTRQVIVNGKIQVVRQTIPWASLKWSLLILLGVGLMQLDQAHHVGVQQILWCVVPILIAAFAYPLGNRKMMEVCQGDINTFQRVLNMTIASLPFWILLAVYALLDSGPPSTGQLTQSFLVAILSGVVATLLFFAATNLIRHDLSKLAAVEATQAGELVFALVGELLWLNAPIPATVSLLGILLVILGMVLHSINPKITRRG